MTDPLTVKLLTQIQQAVCCTAQSVAPPTATAAQVGLLSIAADTGATLTPDAPASSVEIENFDDTYWLAVTFAPFAGILYVRPGGSKVVAVSTPSLVATGNVGIVAVSAPGGVAETPASTVYAQVTLLSQT